MNLSIYLYVALSLAMIFSTTLAVFYVIPIVKKKPLGAALILLLWPHTLRFISLSVYSAVEFGSMRASIDELNQIVAGDTLSAILAFIAILAIKSRKKWAIGFTWFAVIIGSVDFIIALTQSLMSGLPGNVSGFSWVLFVFIIPPLIISEILLLWQLSSRRGEKL